MPQVIVALDVPTVAEAEAMARQIGSPWYKVGLELIYAEGGLAFVKRLMETHAVFLDAKLSDIPTTVERAVASIVRNIEPDILSVRNQVEVAMKAAHGWRTQIAHVPFLTSDPGWHWAEKSEADCVVCPPKFARAFKRKSLGSRIICPGIRLPGSGSDDHVDAQGAADDADFVVVGRPITRSKNPAKIYARYQEALE